MWSDLVYAGDHTRGLGGDHVLRHGRSFLLQLHLLHIPHHRKFLYVGMHVFRNDACVLIIENL